MLVTPDSFSCYTSALQHSAGRVRIVWEGTLGFVFLSMTVTMYTPQSLVRKQTYQSLRTFYPTKDFNCVGSSILPSCFRIYHPYLHRNASVNRFGVAPLSLPIGLNHEIFPTLPVGWRSIIGVIQESLSKSQQRWRW